MNAISLILKTSVLLPLNLVMLLTPDSQGCGVVARLIFGVKPKIAYFAVKPLDMRRTCEGMNAPTLGSVLLFADFAKKPLLKRPPYVFMNASTQASVRLFANTAKRTFQTHRTYDDMNVSMPEGVLLFVDFALSLF